MRKIIFWFDYNLILPIARKTGTGNEFMAFLKKMYPEQFENELKYEQEKADGKEDVDIICPTCKGTEWYLYDTMEDKLSINIQCAHCKGKFNYVFESSVIGKYVKV